MTPPLQELPEPAPAIRLPFQKAITVLMTKDNGAIQAETDLAAVKDETSTVYRQSMPESYFLALRLAVARDPSLTEKIAVFYLGEDNVMRTVALGPDYEDESHWPVGFLDEAWHLEIATKQARWDRKSPEYKESHRARLIGEDTANETPTALPSNVKEVIDGFEKAARRVDTREAPRGETVLDAARSRLEQLYREQQQEIERLQMGVTRQRTDLEQKCIPRSARFPANGSRKRRKGLGHHAGAQRRGICR